MWFLLTQKQPNLWIIALILISFCGLIQNISGNYRENIQKRHIKFDISSLEWKKKKLSDENNVLQFI